MPSVKKNFFYSSILTTANYIFPMITFPYVSRVLGVTNIGICNFVDGIINYFLLFSTLGIGTLGIREMASKRSLGREAMSKSFSSVITMHFITTIIAIIVLMCCIFTVPQMREHKELLLVGLSKLFFSLFLVEWLYKGIEEFKFITIRSLIIRALYVISIFVFVRNCSDYKIYYVLISLTTVANALVNFIYSRKFVDIRLKLVSIKNLWKDNFTLGMYMILTSMYTSFNVAFLGFVSGPTEVGYYTTATKLYGIIIAIFTAFTGVMMPRMSSLLSTGNYEEFKIKLQKSLNLLMAFSVPTIVLFELHASTIIRILSGEGYEGAILPMQIILPLIFIIGYEQIMVMQALIPLKKDKEILINSVLGAISGIMLNIILVKRYASIGSALVWLLCEFIVLVCSQHFYKKYCGNGFPFKSLIKEILRSTFLFLILYVQIHFAHINIYVDLIISCCVFLIYIFCCNKNMIMSTLKL